MKMIPGLIVAAMLCNGVLAQSPALPPAPLPTAPEPQAPEPQAPAPAPPVEQAPPPAPANPPANAPAKKKKKKHAAAKKPAAEAKEVSPLIPNAPAVAKQNNVNVRGKASINGEVIAHLKAGDTVNVLDIVTISHPKTDEPSKWAKIALPEGAHAWINGTFLNADKTVKSSKLNVRTGPGENYSVIGLLHKGDAVKDVNVKGDWTEIEPPASLYAFVAAHLLAPKPPEAPAPTEVSMNQQPPATPGTPSPMGSPLALGAPPTGAPGAPVPPAASPDVPPPLPPPDEPAPTVPRVVQREGIVRDSVSIQAPSYYQLESLDTGEIIDYLYTTSTNVDLGRYKGKTILVTGEEGLDERWPNTPVLTLQKIQVVQ
jgi:SH3-like domain-containing protein